MSVLSLDILHPKERIINTGALARCKWALKGEELFQQFLKAMRSRLKRLATRGTSLHRAEAAVLMRTCRNACEISRLGLTPGRLYSIARTVLEWHIKVRGEANPYAPVYTEYFEQRRCFAWRTLPREKTGQMVLAEV